MANDNKKGAGSENVDQETSQDVSNKGGQSSYNYGGQTSHNYEQSKNPAQNQNQGDSGVMEDQNQDEEVAEDTGFGEASGRGADQTE